MSIEARQKQVIEAFQAFPDWEQRYKHLIAFGKQLPPYPDGFRGEEYKVKGCQSQVWLHATLNDTGEVEFMADSDAMIVKGLAAILVHVYSKARPAEILASKPEFLSLMGLENHLSPSRANGLYAMLKQMMYYATAFQALGAASLS